MLAVGPARGKNLDDAGGTMSRDEPRERPMHVTQIVGG